MKSKKVEVHHLLFNTFSSMFDWEECLSIDIHQQKYVVLSLSIDKYFHEANTIPTIKPLNTDVLLDLLLWILLNF